MVYVMASAEADNLDKAMYVGMYIASFAWDYAYFDRYSASFRPNLFKWKQLQVHCCIGLVLTSSVSLASV